MDRWNRTSHLLTRHAGSKQFFGVVVAFVVGWSAYGVLVAASRPWELVVTCGVPVLTLLLVVMLQHAQNRDTKATHLKLNELLLALEGPDSKMIDAGHLGDGELDDLTQQYEARA